MDHAFELEDLLIRMWWCFYRISVQRTVTLKGLPILDSCSIQSIRSLGYLQRQ
jgi:hypothetical protein